MNKLNDDIREDDTTTREEWDEALIVEVMDDYLRDARFGERLITPEDEKEHLVVMRKHFDKLKSFILSREQWARADERKAVLREIEEVKDYYLNDEDAFNNGLQAMKQDIIKKLNK